MCASKNRKTPSYVFLGFGLPRMRHADRFNMSVVGSKPEESQKASESPDGCASTHKLSAYYEKQNKSQSFPISCCSFEQR